jgi:hypothetical protein
MSVTSDPGNEAIEFLEMLRPGGPWLLTAIIPDGTTDTITAQTADEARGFVATYYGQRNLYYSVNPTRKPMNKKASKTDIAAIEYLPSDLDPKPNETSEAAKARYLAEIENLKPSPTAIIDSGNGLNLLLKLAEPVILPEPVTVTKRGKKVKAFPEATEKQIADIEDRAKRLMEKLGSVAGTQNIDRILRLPGTINLPNKKKAGEERTACPTRLIKFNGATCKLEDFPKAEEPKGSAKTELPKRAATKELPMRLADMLVVADKGAGEKHGKYESRSALLFGFLLGCLRANVDADVMYEACLDDKYRGNAIYRHCYDQGNPVAYVERQIARAEEKYSTSTNAEIERLLLLSMIEYEQQRKQAAKELGVRVSQLDRMVEGARKRDQTDDFDKQVAEINAEYALVLAGNKAAVMKFEDKTKFRPLQVGAFKQWFANQLVTVGKTTVSLGDYWLSHKERRQYVGIEFAPPGSAARTGYYNLFRGLPSNRCKATARSSSRT